MQCGQPIYDALMAEARLGYAVKYKVEALKLTLWRLICLSIMYRYGA